MEDHSDKQRIASEMFLRRFPPLSAPVTVLQNFSVVTPDDRSGERAAMLAMPGVYDHEIVEHPRYVQGISPTGTCFLWERLSEASTVTAVLPGFPDSDLLNEAEALAASWLGEARGQNLRAVRITIVENEEEAHSLLVVAARGEVVSCRVGEARLWSSFQPGDDGTEWLLISSGSMPPSDLDRLVQQIQELGNYRCLALLGLPLVQAHTALLSVLEQNLTEISNRLNSRVDDEGLLERLCRLAARTAAIDASTSFRLSATAAYAQIVADRLRVRTH